MIIALKEDRVVISLMCEGREFHSLEADEEKELEPEVVWWKSMIKFKGWYEWRSLVGVGAKWSKFGGR